MFTDEHVAIVAKHVEELAPELKKEKANGVIFGQSEDWPWLGFVLSYATYGGSANWTNNVAPRIAEFGWPHVRALAAEDRAKLFSSVPNPRFRVRSAANLEATFQRFVAAGGPAAVRTRWASFISADELIKELLTYPGIGPKYARNIPMDVHHPLMREHFAVDHRLETILQVAGCKKRPYRDAEAALRDLARRVGVDAWTLDRTLYARHKQIVREIESCSAGNWSVSSQKSEAA